LRRARTAPRPPRKRQLLGGSSRSGGPATARDAALTNELTSDGSNEIERLDETVGRAGVRAPRTMLYHSCVPFAAQPTSAASTPCGYRAPTRLRRPPDGPCEDHRSSRPAATSSSAGSATATIACARMAQEFTDEIEGNRTSLSGLDRPAAQACPGFDLRSSEIVEKSTRRFVELRRVDAANGPAVGVAQERRENPIWKLQVRAADHGGWAAAKPSRVYVSAPDLTPSRVPFDVLEVCRVVMPNGRPCPTLRPSTVSSSAFFAAYQPRRANQCPLRSARKLPAAGSNPTRPLRTDLLDAATELNRAPRSARCSTLPLPTGLNRELLLYRGVRAPCASGVSRGSPLPRNTALLAPAFLRPGRDPADRTSPPDPRLNAGPGKLPPPIAACRNGHILRFAPATSAVPVVGVAQTPGPADPADPCCSATRALWVFTRARPSSAR